MHGLTKYTAGMANGQVAAILLIASWITCTGRGQTPPASIDCNGALSAPISFMDLPGLPWSAVSTKDSCWVFVSLTSTSHPRSVSGIGLLRHLGGKFQLQRTVAVERAPTGLALTHDEKLLVVADGAYLVFLDATRVLTGTGDPIIGYLAGASGDGILSPTITADDKFLFVTKEYAKGVMVIDLVKARAGGFQQDSVVGVVPVGGTTGPGPLALSPDNKFLYTTVPVASPEWNWPIECKPELMWRTTSHPAGADLSAAKPEFPQGAIVIMDVARAKSEPSNAVLARIPAGCVASRIGITSDGTKLWTTARADRLAMMFDSAKLLDDPQHSLISTVPVGAAPLGIVIGESGKRVIVANSNRNTKEADAPSTLTVIDTTQNGGKGAAIGTVQAGIFPRELSLSPDQRTLYVSNYGSQSLEIVDLTRMPLQPFGR